MSGIIAALTMLTGMAILVLPRRWAPVALLMGTCYVTRAQGIELGPLSFTVVRILIAIALLRIILRGEWRMTARHGLDRVIVLWGTWMVLSVLFHKDASSSAIYRFGLVFDAWGAYFAIRCFCRTWKEATDLCNMVGLVLLPIAAEMLVEKMTAHNYFSVFGGVDALPHIRQGHVRAQGPFGHAILAGTIGAVCLPLVLSVWKYHRRTVAIGCLACLTIVFASSSSGPIMSAGAGIVALGSWRLRDRMALIRRAAVVAYVGLELIMRDPAYYVIARIDVAGGSTGWHRARLIESSIEHLSEWWIVGTDYTRHWMTSGVSWSPDHADITNHYLQMGVFGGLLLLVLFVAIIWQGFVAVGESLRQSDARTQFALWALGASLFAHATTCISVSYFDQSAVFLYLTLGLIGSIRADTVSSGTAELSTRRPALRAMRRPATNIGEIAPRAANVAASPLSRRKSSERFWSQRTIANRHRRARIAPSMALGLQRIDPDE